MMGSLFTLTVVINAAVATLVIIQSLAQVAAIVVLSIGLSLGWIAIGTVAYLAYAKSEHTWPFGPKEIKEAFAHHD